MNTSFRAYVTDQDRFKMPVPIASHDVSINPPIFPPLSHRSLPAAATLPPSKAPPPPAPRPFHSALD